MNHKSRCLLCLFALAPAAWAQTETKPATKITIPEHGTAIVTAGTKSTAITSETTLRRYGRATPAEAKSQLVQYRAQEAALFAQRLAAYREMQGKSEDEQGRIWSKMIEAQRQPLAEHRALEKRLATALKDEKEKAAAAAIAARPVEKR